jgi:hypothetical protein
MEMEWNLSIFVDLSFFGRQNLVKTSFSISLFMLKPSQIYLSHRWQHFNYFSIGSNKPEHEGKPTTPYFSFRFGNRSIQVSVLTRKGLTRVAGNPVAALTNMVVTLINLFLPGPVVLARRWFVARSVTRVALPFRAGSWRAGHLPVSHSPQGHFEVV